MSVIALTWLSVAPAASPPCLIETRKLVVQGAPESSNLAWRVTRRAKERGITLSVRDEAGDVRRVVPWSEATPGAKRLYRAVSVDALALLWFLLEVGEADREYDLRRRVRDKAYRPVSFRWSGNDILIEEGPVSEPYRTDAPTAEDLAQRWQIAGVTEEDASWAPHRLGMLDDALALLDARELAAIRDVPFVRRVKAPSAETHGSDEPAAMYFRGDAQQPTMIAVLDGGLTGDALSFTGEPSAPRPTAVRILLHEIGHALADAPVRRDEGPGSVLERFEQVPGATQGPTPYGATRIEEGFAEAFSLFHTDPAALRRCQPQVWAWFDTAEHLR